MTWVKICGLTRREDVAAAIAAGADAVGFVLAADSPRRVSVEEAAALGHGAAAMRVLVTVDEPLAGVMAALEGSGADGIQPHGRHSGEVAAAAAAAGVFVLRPIRVTGPVRLDDPRPGQIPLLDTHRDGVHGGTGESFDWAHAAGIDGRFVLAGGLGPDNVGRAVRLVRPWGVDASSRLEVEPGIKDPGKVAAFIQEAKQA